MSSSVILMLARWRWIVTMSSLLATSRTLSSGLTASDSRIMLTCKSCEGYPIESRTMKRSSCESGNCCVPAEPRGFCVAMTMKGLGRSCVTPSTVTARSSMTSSRAACVLAEVRLISSPRSRLQKTAPGRKTNECVSSSYMLKPVMSAGIVSGVNWMRRYSKPSAREKASASVVLPTPGASSSKTLPLA